MHTNLDSHGGTFRSILDTEFKQASNVSVASGYASLDLMTAYKNDFIRIAENGGCSKLLLGMAFYEGLSEKKLNFAIRLDEQLRGYSDKSGVYVAYGRRYHGKIYKFDSRNHSNIYMGSSNFSVSGTKGNIECTLKVYEESQKAKINKFLDDLYSNKHSVGINQVEILIPNMCKQVKSKVDKLWKSLEKHQISFKQAQLMPRLELDLQRIVDKEKSNLNIYFGKGRWNRSSNKIKPRPWYEVEIIADQNVRKSPLYPKGDFYLFTDDNLIIPMSTQGDNYKNIRSKNSLQIFGKWIKGKLEKSGCLKMYKPITQETLSEYGSTTIQLYKLKESEYFITF